MEIHVLNGDALIERFQLADLEGKCVVARECLMEGPIRSTSIENFWKLRARYVSQTFNISEKEYFEHVVKEYRKLEKINEESKINLWFENDLFCQVNMWFVISYLFDLSLTSTLFRVFPKEKKDDSKWVGFGKLPATDLNNSYLNRVRFSEAEITLGRSLWSAYVNDDFDKLKMLSKERTLCFHNLEEVVKAHLDRFPSAGEPGRPEKTLIELKKRGLSSFEEIFNEFFKTEGIYGFGDLQVKNMLSRLN